VVDDLHEADQASLRLLHYLSRCAIGEQVLIILAHRRAPTLAAQEVLDSLVNRAAGTAVELQPLTESATMQLLADRFPDLPAKTAAHIWTVSAGLPFTILEMAHGHGNRAGGVLSVLPGSTLRTFQRVALLGSTFTTDELLTVSGASEDETYRHLETALAALIIEPAESGYRFRHALVREARGITGGMKRSVLAGPEGHPFHPFVVPLPIGAFVSSLIFDVLTRTRADGLPYLVDGAFWLIGVGLIGALIAAVFGVLDLLTIPRRTPPFTTAVAHLTLNVAASVLFLIGYAWRAGDHVELDKTRWGQLTLSAVSYCRVVNAARSCRPGC
jgi:uncharacterized membrane protein